ncbi:hypothetical protein DRN75_03345 [Nanoarchaeota archaeon]|nr:MAG: hypothetical protein DRN75_03345 [Nanoarchaeota archaeon]
MRKKELKKKKSISKAVEEILDSRPFIKDVFKINAVNYSGLARYLIPILQKRLEKRKINIEGVIMAIRRYAEKIKGIPVSIKLLEALVKCDLRLKGNIVDFTLKRSSYNYETILEVYKKIKWEEGDIIYIYQSLTEIAVILDKKNTDLISKKVAESEIIHKEENLAMITLKTPPEIVESPGVFYYLLGLIASEGISLVDIISTYTELVLIVKEEDGAKTYNILFDAIKKARKMK